jgi:hypothetical protein
VPQQSGPLYDAVISFRKHVERAAVWKFETTFEGVGSMDPYVYGMDMAITSCGIQERRQIVALLRDATGYFYKGIHKDVDSVMRAIRLGRSDGGVCVVYHHLVSAKVFMVGEIRFRVWTRRP